MKLVGGRQNFGKIFLNTKYTEVTKGKMAQNRQEFFLGVLPWHRPPGQVCALRVWAFQKTDAHPKLVIAHKFLFAANTCTALRSVQCRCYANFREWGKKNSCKFVTSCPQGKFAA
jgi:hypothetical protein